LDGQLKFRTDVKIKHSDVTADELYELQVLAAKQVQAELDKKKDVQGFEKVKFGTLVYVKSSVTAPKGKPYIPRRDNKGERNLQFDTYKYKIYHPDFPHESTADQFFDLVQWEAYFQLGQFIGKDVLDMQSKLFMKYQAENDSPKDISIDDLIACFDDGRNLFAPTLADILEAEEEEIIITDGRGLESATAKIQEEVPAIADESELDVGYEM
jgi:hypothetical protein